MAEEEACTVTRQRSRTTGAGAKGLRHLDRLQSRVFKRQSHPARRRKSTGQAPNMDLVSWTLGNCAVADNKMILADASSPEHQLTKGHVVALVRHIVAGLCNENWGEYLNGDVVCVHDFNGIFYPVLFQAILGAGGCFTGTNPAYTRTELEHHFRKSDTKYVVTTAANLDRVVQAAITCQIPITQIFVFNATDTYEFVQRKLKSNSSTPPVDSGHASNASSPVRDGKDPLETLTPFKKLLECGQRDWIVLDGRDGSRNTRAALFSTSGTSGLPKIAARTHYNLITECMAIQDHRMKPYHPVRLLCVPLFHAFASPLGNILAMREGVPTFVMPRFQEIEFLEAVEQYQITETALVPPVIVKWLAQPSDTRHRQLESVRIIWCGGAPMAPDVQDRAVDQMLRPDARIVQVWGLTECGWLSTFHYPEKDSTGSVGRALPGYQIKLVDGNDRIVRKGRGEVIAKSEAVMQCYLNDEMSTSEAFTEDGFYRTGDIGEIWNGKIYIVDRKKELIKVRGWQVAPAELEGILLQNGSIDDAAVIGVTVVPDSGEEVPEAYVVRAEGVELTVRDIKDFLLQYLAKYKVADCEVVFCDSIPKSASGKILRKVLRSERRAKEEKKRVG